MGGKSTPATQTVNQVTKSDPWAPAQPFIMDALTRAKTALDATPNTPYTGNLYAGPTDAQRRGVQGMIDMAPGTATGAAELRQLGLDTVSGKYLSPDSNPYIKGAVDAALRPIQQSLNQNIMAIGDTFSGAGAYGGSNQALMSSRAVNDWANTSADTSSRIYAGNYENERQRQMMGAGLLDAANALAMQPNQILLQAGGIQQGWDQNALQEAFTKYQMAQDAPWAGLDRYAQLLGLAQGYGTQTTNGTTTSTAARPSTLAGMFQGGVGGASAGSAFGPWGMGIGGIIGALGGAFG